MSLINVRNFLIPIQNKYQMGALLVIALVIAVVRVVGSGGAEPVGNRENLNLNDEIKSFLASQQPSTLSQKERAGSAAPSADPFQNELLPDGWEDEEAKDVPAPDQAKNNKGFSDVKKALGLE